MLRATADSITQICPPSATLRNRIGSRVVFHHHHGFGLVCFWTLGNGLTNGATSSDTGQQVNHPRSCLSFKFVIGPKSPYRTYQYMNESMTWQDSYCRQQHTDLTSISSPEQQNLLSNESSLWIGLFLDSWVWSDQTNLSFRYWEADQPSQSSGSGDCVGMSSNNSGKWAQYSCDLPQPFICYGGEFCWSLSKQRLKTIVII
uniref:C-type lectin domain-containing protein n=1 Tax=Cyprinus carpio TaxID=7962 RepID=A0A8C1ZMF6_CYPCA